MRPSERRKPGGDRANANTEALNEPQFTCFVDTSPPVRDDDAAGQESTIASSGCPAIAEGLIVDSGPQIRRIDRLGGRAASPAQAAAALAAKRAAEARWQAARQVLTARGFVMHRATDSDGVSVYSVHRWGRERVLNSLDELAAFVRLACATEATS